MLITADAAFAHEEAIAPNHWKSAWSFEPAIFLPLALSGVLYAAGVLRIYRVEHLRRAIQKWEVGSFAIGWLSLLIALNSPLHRLGEVLFSAHMTQHEILMVLAAPLLVLGRPLVVFLFALPRDWRPAISGWTKYPSVSRVWRALTKPLTVWVAHGLAIWLWHIPSLYEATLQYGGVHAFQHICFLGTALLFWWTLIHGRYGRYGYGAGFLYVFTTAVHTTVLGALMTFAQRVWYPIYEGRTISWHLTPLEDQQLGGLIMWIPSGTIFIIVGLAMFAAWLGESERRRKLSSLEAISERTEVKNAA